MKTLIIIGAGGHGRVCADIASKLNKYDNIYFYDENKSGKISDIIILNHNISSLLNNKTHFIVAIGDNEQRKKIISYLLASKATLTNIIDPTVIISNNVNLGVGIVIMPNVVINVGAEIGNGVILNSSCIIEHDCIIGDFVHISPGAVLAGSVKIGDLSWIGANSTVIQNININKNVIIGAGSVVIGDVNESGTYVGIPSRKVK